MLNAVRPPKARTFAFLAAGAAALAAVLPAPAQAGTAASAFAASAFAKLAVAAPCSRAAPALFTTTQFAGAAALVSRPRPRPMSALERMRAQQAGALGLADAQAVADRPAYMPGIAARASFGSAEAAATVVPAAAFGIRCGSPFDAARPALRKTGFDFLESHVLPVSSTAFDAAWNRVSGDAAGLGMARAAVLQADADKGAIENRIAKVNRWVNRRIAYASDAKLYGKADHWASLRETLSRGKGDCEDYAIAKMEILAAMGVAREDMYLTLARDLVRRDDHAVLIVKLDGRSILLDNASDALIDGDKANDYRPIMSFSADRRFVHGY